MLETKTSQLESSLLFDWLDCFVLPFDWWFASRTFVIDRVLFLGSLNEHKICNDVAFFDNLIFTAAFSGNRLFYRLLYQYPSQIIEKSTETGEKNKNNGKNKHK